MATTTRGQGQALMIINAETNKPIDLPLANQEAILAPIINFKTWVRKRMRRGGIGKMIPGGKIAYYAFPKQTSSRDISIIYDEATGKISGGMYGAADANNMIGGIKSKYGVTLLKDEITLATGEFDKHVLSNHDLKEDGLAKTVALKFADFTAELAEKGLVQLKLLYVQAMGTMGKWAKDAKFVLPTVGIGKRVKNKTYSGDAAGGLEAREDIVKQLIYRDKIGLKDGVEKNYPLARGLNSSKSVLIEISGSVNANLLKALEISQNGFVAGIGADSSKSLITSISYEGRTVNIDVINDMPQKGGKDFNWNIVEIGNYGSLALPNKFYNAAIVRPHYEGFSMLYKVLEMLGLTYGLKFLQPELMFSCFTA